MYLFTIIICSNMEFDVYNIKKKNVADSNDLFRLCFAL